VAAPGSGRFRTVLLLAKVGLSAGLMAWLFQRIPLASVGETLRHVRGAWLVSAALLLIFSNVIGSYQWHRLLGVIGIRIPFWTTFAYYHVGLFFNNFLPGNIGGDIARVMDAARHGPTRAAAFSTVLLDRLIGTVALAGLALITTLPAVDQFHLSMAYVALATFFAASVLVLWALFHPALLPAVERALSRVGLGGLKPHLDELAARLQGFRSRRRLLVGLFLIATVTQVSRIGVHVLVARALSLHIPVPYFFLFVPLVAVIVSLPISLNGIGVREGAGIVLFGLIGVSRAQAFSLQFTTYLVAVAISLIGGLIVLLRLPMRRTETRQHGRSS
jgi:uncharacterized protein (TIRG00374 family)